MLKSYLMPLLLMMTVPALGQIISTSPRPGSQYHNPQTTILLTSMEAIDASSLDRPGIFEVRGSMSGRHEFDVKLLRNGHLVSLVPNEVFQEGEEVTVVMNQGVESLSGKQLDPVSFTFFIRSPRTKEQEVAISRMKGMIYEAEFGSVNSSKPFGLLKPGLPDLTILTNSTTSTGKVFFSDFNFYLSDEAYYCIINNEGDSIYGKWDTVTFNNFDLNRNGFMTAYNKHDSVFVMFDSNYAAIRTFQMGNGYTADVHEFVIMPDGSRFMMCYDAQIVDMTVYNPNYNPAATVVGCVVQELDAADNVLFEWRSWDHIPITDADHIFLAGAYIDAVHSNAIDIDQDGNLLLTSRHLSEVTKINRTTGEVMWRLGGGNGNEFTFIGDSEKFSWPHDGHRLANGHLLIFDNGNHHAPPISYVKEYVLDEVNKTATLVWSYSRVITEGTVFSAAMGNAQRLDNGNTFICWGLVNLLNGAPKMTEVDSAGNVVWELKLSDQDAVYRARRHEWNPCARPTNSTIKASNITSTSAKLNWKPATNAASYDVQYRKTGTSTWTSDNFTTTSIKVKNLLPSTKYEFQIRSKCTNAGVSKSGWSELKKFKTLPQRMELEEPADPVFIIYPNPVQDFLNIGFSLDDPLKIDVRVLDATGKTVWQVSHQGEEGENNLIIETASLPPGYYLLQFYSENLNQVKSFIRR